MTIEGTNGPGLTLRRGDTLILIPDDEAGELVTRVFADVDDARRWVDERRKQSALNAIGAWSHLDADEMLDALDRIRHESQPTPPIEDL
jgi:2'-5' RNA ligase